MQQAATRLAEIIDRSPLRDPQVPVVTNMAGQVRTSAEHIRAELASQMVAPVEWVGSVREMVANGVDTFVDLAGGAVAADPPHQQRCQGDQPQRRRRGAARPARRIHGQIVQAREQAGTARALGAQLYQHGSSYREENSVRHGNGLRDGSAFRDGICPPARICLAGRRKVAGRGFPLRLVTMSAYG